jgi:hypothetical protein
MCVQNGVRAGLQRHPSVQGPRPGRRRLVLSWLRRIVPELDEIAVLAYHVTHERLV